MTKEEAKSFFTLHSYLYDRDSEYNRDVYTKVLPSEAKIEVFVDRYTLKAVWWPERQKKVGTSAPLAKLDEGLMEMIIKELTGGNF